MANLLKNPGFDGPFRAWNGIEEITVAEGWLPFWVAHLPSDEAWKNQQPSYRAALRGVDARRARSGPAAQMYSTNWATHIAGIMQVVEGITPGQRLSLSAYGHAWSTSADSPDQSIDPGNLRLKIGIDPNGGSNPFDSAVVWSTERLNYDLYGKPFTVEATANGSRVTIFLLSAVDWPKKHNDVFWDDVSLEAISSISAALASDKDVLLALSSPAKLVGAPVAVDVTAVQQLANPHLLVSGPRGAVSPIERGSGKGGRGYVWHWEFTPDSPGPYTVTFTTDDTPAVSSTLDITAPLSSAVVVASSPASSPTISIAGRGRPRTQYHRVYILLPPSAGKDWIQAILDSGAWTDNRWTVGYSADDAGIGDLDRRTIIVLNPSSWPDPIISWLQMWYPGAVVYPITAVSPSDLRIVLKTLDPSAAPEFG